MANFSEKFQGEIAEFLIENMKLYRQNLKNSGKYRYFLEKILDFLGKFSTISPRKKRQLIMEKNKKWGVPSPISLHCLPEECLGPRLPMKGIAKTQIRLGRCPGWSEFLLDTQVILLVLSCSNQISANI